MTFFAIRSYYADCPTCSPGMGDPQLVSYLSLEAFMIEYHATTDYRYYNLYVIPDDGKLRLLAELSDNMSFHHVSGKTIDVVGKNGLCVKTFDIYTTSAPSADYVKEIIDCLQEQCEKI